LRGPRIADARISTDRRVAFILEVSFCVSLRGRNRGPPAGRVSLLREMSRKRAASPSMGALSSAILAK
jgi:hypothetical protein